MSRDINKWIHQSPEHSSGVLANKEGETDVTVKIEDPTGEEVYVNGFFRSLGSIVNGVELDQDESFGLEYERPELRLTVLGYSGQIKALKAWINTPKGPQVVFRQLFEEPISVLSDECLDVVGPAF